MPSNAAGVGWFHSARCCRTILAAGLWLGPRLWVPVRGWLGRRLPERWSGRLARVDDWVTNVQMLRSMRVVAPVVVLTGLVWLVMLATNLLVLRSLGLDADARAGGLVLALVYLGVAPALMPGNFGPFYFFAMLGLTPFGIPEARSAARSPCCCTRWSPCRRSCWRAIPGSQPLD